MTDHDRGAYSPQTDAPLAFDARQARGGGRGFPTTLVVSLVILAGLIVALVLFYRSGVREAGQGPATVGAPVAQIKAPAPQGGQSTDPATGLQIYKTETAPSGAAPAPAFAAPPEQPQARPVAPVTAQPLPSPAVVAASGATTTVHPAPIQAVPAQPVPVQTTAAPAKPQAGSRDPIGALLDKKPVPAKPAVMAQAGAPPAPVAAKPIPARPDAAGGASVQIGAYSSQALAEKGWDDLAQGFAADMAGKGKHFEPVAKGDATLYRAAVTGFASHDAAVAFCAKLKAAGHACIVK